MGFIIRFSGHKLLKIDYLDALKEIVAYTMVEVLKVDFFDDNTILIYSYIYFGI
jgi:hypothetical protein